MKKDLISISSWAPEAIDLLFTRAAELKRKLAEGVNYQPLRGKTLALIFEKRSTRTRVSFQVGMHQLGGEALVLNWQDLHLGQGESVEDTARVLSRYVDGMVLRTYSHRVIEDFARSATVPVINGLSDLLHPCQVLSDVFTIQEKLGRYREIEVAYIGDGNNVANSWVTGAAKLGFQLTLACPEGYDPSVAILETALAECPSRIKIVRDPRQAVEKAQVIATDVWISMGQESESERRRVIFEGFTVNEELLRQARRDVLVMHCLPAHRGEEIADSVLDGPNSIVLDQAENRLHVQKAILEKLLLGA